VEANISEQRSWGRINKICSILRTYYSDKLSKKQKLEKFLSLRCSTYSFSAAGISGSSSDPCVVNSIYSLAATI